MKCNNELISQCPDYITKLALAEFENYMKTKNVSLNEIQIKLAKDVFSYIPSSESEDVCVCEVLDAISIWMKKVRTR